MCFVNKNKGTKYYKSTASPNNFKKDLHIIKLHTDEGPKEGGILSLQEIYDQQEVFREESRESLVGSLGTCALCV